MMHVPHAKQAMHALYALLLDVIRHEVLQCGCIKAQINKKREKRKVAKRFVTRDTRGL